MLPGQGREGASARGPQRPPTPAPRSAGGGQPRSVLPPLVSAGTRFSRPLPEAPGSQLRLLPPARSRDWRWTGRALCGRRPSGLGLIPSWSLAGRPVDPRTPRARACGPPATPNPASGSQCDARGACAREPVCLRSCVCTCACVQEAGGEPGGRLTPTPALRGEGSPRVPEGAPAVSVGATLLFRPRPCWRAVGGGRYPGPAPSAPRDHPLDTAWPRLAVGCPRPPRRVYGADTGRGRDGVADAGASERGEPAGTAGGGREAQGRSVVSQAVRRQGLAAFPPPPPGP